MIIGILSMSNGTGLEYPYPLVVLSLSGLCDKVLIGTDPSFPEDRKRIEQMGLPNVGFVDSVWDRSVDAGREIAAQMDALVFAAQEDGADWVVVLQADELLHENDFDYLRHTMESVPEHITGLSLERLYFWGALNKIRQDWNACLIRIFRPGYFSFLAENTDKAGMFSGRVKEGEVLDISCNIYHYSRIGDPSLISSRVRNLDTFFHREEELVPVDKLPDYDFQGREFDNFNVVSPPPKKEMTIVDYEGTHPLCVEEWYEEQA